MCVYRHFLSFGVPKYGGVTLMFFSTVKFMSKSLIVCWCEKTSAYTDLISLFIHNVNSLQAKTCKYVCSQQVRDRKGGQKEGEGNKHECICIHQFLVLGLSSPPLPPALFQMQMLQCCCVSCLFYFLFFVVQCKM